MTTRRSYNASMAAWRALHPTAPPETILAMADFDQHCREIFGAAPVSEAEVYAAEAAIESKQCIPGRSED